MGNDLNQTNTCIGNIGIAPKKIIISEMSLKKVENGFLVSCYQLGTFVFLTVGEATDFIKDNIGEEIKQ